jgi:hypothetical protein
MLREIRWKSYLVSGRLVQLLVTAHVYLTVHRLMVITYLSVALQKRKNYCRLGDDALPQTCCHRRVWNSRVVMREYTRFVSSV